MICNKTWDFSYEQKPYSYHLSRAEVVDCLVDTEMYSTKRCRAVDGASRIRRSRRPQSTRLGYWCLDAHDCGRITW